MQKSNIELPYNLTREYYDKSEFNYVLIIVALIVIIVVVIVFQLDYPEETHHRHENCNKNNRSDG